MTHRLLSVVTAAVVAITGRPVAGQENVQHRSSAHSVRAFGFVPAESGLSEKPHAPFSAVVVERLERTLSDGTRITLENQEVVMRDGEGRIYRGRQIRRLGAGESEPLSPVMFTITDPVRHIQYLCMPFGKHCASMEYRPSPAIPRPVSPGLGRRNDVTVEDLGISHASGVEVEGKLTTRRIAEGTVGNDRPFTSTEEVWHSKELEVDVEVKRADPRMGTSTSTMTQVSLSEPDPTYFHVPADYFVEARTQTRGAMAPAAEGGEARFPSRIPLPPEKDH